MRPRRAAIVSCPPRLRLRFAFLAHSTPYPQSPHLCTTTTIYESAFNDGKVRPTLRLFMLLGLLDDAVKNGNKKSLSEWASTLAWTVFGVFDAMNYVGIATENKAIGTESHGEIGLVVCRAWLAGELIGFYDQLTAGGAFNPSTLTGSICNIVLAINWSTRGGGPLSDETIGAIGVVGAFLQLQRNYAAHCKGEEDAAAAAAPKKS